MYKWNSYVGTEKGFFQISAWVENEALPYQDIFQSSYFQPHGPRDLN